MRPDTRADPEDTKPYPLLMIQPCLHVILTVSVGLVAEVDIGHSCNALEVNHKATQIGVSSVPSSPIVSQNILTLGVRVVVTCMEASVHFGHYS